MWPNFWKASLISLLGYTVAVLMGIWMGFWITLFVVPVLQIGWGLFCIIRIIQLRRSGGNQPDAPRYDRDSYGFSLGGLISSLALLGVLVVLSQAV